MHAKEVQRGRPRSFDVEGALVTAEALFHDKGYDAVGVAMLAGAIGINPPSFYAAFGSKAALFGRVMDRYMARGLRLDAFIEAGLGPADALRAYLTRAARLYAADPKAAGCLVFEAARGRDNAEVTAIARNRKDSCRERIRAYLAATHPATADAVADTVVAVMSGLSAGAREGWNEDRLVAIAEMTAVGFATALP